MYKLNYFNFREKENEYLITNDMGKYAFITKENFQKIINKEDIEENLKQE